MRVLCAPTALLDSPTLFLGGSISGAWNWQEYVIEKLMGMSSLAYHPITIFNPRRENFDTTDKVVEKDQIKWEFRHLRIADALMFWFSGETLAPITLFELGRHSMFAGRPIFVGVDPEYKRASDVRIQMSLVNPELHVQKSLDEVINEVKWWAKFWQK